MLNRTLSVDGLRVNVAEWGAGPPVVLVHGLVGSLDYWAPFAERLSRRRRVIAVDVPGHGGSDPLETFSFDRLVEVLAEATDQLEVESPAIVGHSFGAPIAICWAAARPVSALVLASPVGIAPLHISRARAVLPARKVLAKTERLWESAASRSRISRRVIFGWFVGMNDLDGLGTDQARSLLRGAAVASPVVSAALPALDDLDLRSIALGLDVPAMVVWGELDGQAWDNGPALADLLGAQEVVLPGVGHMPMIEAPYSFGVAVADFV